MWLMIIIAAVLGFLAHRFIKLSPTEPKGVTPSLWSCDCGKDRGGHPGKLTEDEVLPKTGQGFRPINKTEVLPVAYDSYKPINLSKPVEGHSSLVTAALCLPSKKEEENILTPFAQILHATHYAHRHAYLIHELVDNYEHIEG
ncbi:hypothetical protein AAVH_31913 [Aphelenchoides avenae]|nr:hypothetical protein AAVH_31913 [Aphelenchus avenae]